MLDIEKLEIILICALAFFALLNIASFFCGIAYRKKIAEAKLGSAEKEAQSIIDNAVKSADARKRELMLEAKEENQKMRADLDKEMKERRSEISRQERRLAQKEENLDKKTEALEKKDNTLNQKLKELEQKNQEIADIKNEQTVQL